MPLKPWSNSKAGSSVKRSFESIIDKYGHYALYRRYTIGTPSEFYQTDTGSSIGGPKWEYVDEIIKIRHDPMSVRGAVGVTVQQSKMYLPRSIKPKRGDVIIEIDYAETDTSPTEHEMYTADHTEAFEITEIDTKRGFKGHIEFYIIQVVPHMGDY